MALFVYVATTQGLVQVQSIAQEDPDIDSLVCLDGSMKQLPISLDYHQFVKKGSGLIHKDFHHGAFRLDVDKPIDSGNSWQLGFYLAHYCFDKNILANGQPQAGDTVVWATGEVKIDKSLGPVAGVAQKCQQSAHQLLDWQQTGVKLLCVLPRGNQEDIEPIAGVTFLACDQLAEVLEAFDGLVQAGSIDNNGLDDGQLLVEKAWYWRYKWPSIFLGLASLAMLGLVMLGSSLDSKTLGLASEPVVSVNDEQSVVSHQIPTESVHVEKTLTRPYLQALVKTSTEDCIDANPTNLIATDFRFTAIRLDSLCQLALMLPKANMQVMGIALDTGGEIPLQSKEANRWDIAIPTSKYQNRDYILLLFDESFYAQGRNPLTNQMRRWRWDDKSLSARLIQHWVNDNNWPVLVYRHQLQDD